MLVEVLVRFSRCLFFLVELKRISDLFTPAQFRRHLHKTFLLKCDQPLFRRMNKFVFDEDKRVKGPLINVHEGLKNPGKYCHFIIYTSSKSKEIKLDPKGSGYEIGLVSGNYTYHHYLQDKFNDDGWGCAYRSLQTIISWFRLNIQLIFHSKLKNTNLILETIFSDSKDILLPKFQPMHRSASFDILFLFFVIISFYVKLLYQSRFKNVWSI